MPFYLNAILRLSIFTQYLLVAMCDWANQQWQFNGWLLMFSKANNKKMIKDAWQLQSELYETMISIKCLKRENNPIDFEANIFISVLAKQRTQTLSRI